MQAKSERNQVNYPISNVAITTDNGVITQITVEIEDSAFDYKFEDSTEIQIIAKVLTGKISPHQGFKECCNECYSYGRDINSYPSAVLLRFVLSNSQEPKPFVKGSLFDEINSCIGNVPQSSYNFRL